MIKTKRKEGSRPEKWEGRGDEERVKERREENGGEAGKGREKKE